MSEVTRKINYSRLTNVLLIIGIAVLLVFLIRSCGNEKSASIAYNKIRDTLQSVLDDTARINGENRRLLYEAADMDLHVSDLVADLTMTKGALIDESNKSIELARRLKGRPIITHRDTLLYMDGCDSLSEAVITQGFQIKYLKRLSDSLEYYHVQVENNLKAQRDNFKFGYDSCKNAVRGAVTELPKLEPKSKVYFDITGMAGAITAFGGGLGYMDANGRIINADVLVSGHGNIYQLRLATPLNFKRKQ